MTVKAALSLAEFIAVVQDGLQRSYDFIEDVAEGGRDGRPQEVLLTVSEVALSIPVEWSTRRQAVDFSPLEPENGSTTAYQLERLLLEMPMADPELRRTIRDQAYSALSRQRFEESSLASESGGEALRNVPDPERQGGRRMRSPTPESRPTLDIRISEEARKIIKRISVSRKEAEPEIAVSVLGEEAIRGSGGATGRLELRFKPVLG